MGAGVALVAAAATAYAVLPRGGGASPPAGPTAPATTTTARTTAGAATTPATPGAQAGPDAAARRRAVARVARLGVPLYRAGGRKGKVVALTFDDGPGPYTDTTRKTLARYGAAATFFVNGTSMERFPAELRREAKDADVELASHTWAHLYLPGLAPAAAWTQQEDTAAYLRRHAGHEPDLMRPPYGAHTPDLQSRLTQRGVTMVLWDIDSGDSLGADWSTMLTRLKRDIRPGSIVLMHENRGQTQKVVNRLVPYLAKRGWRMVTVSQLLALDPPSDGQLRAEAARRAGGAAGTRYPAG